MLKFQSNRKLVTGSLVIVGVLWLLYVGIMLLDPRGIVLRGIELAVGGVVVLILVWVGLTYGTSIIIDDQRKLLYGTFFFLKLSNVSLRDVISLNERKTFAGGITRLYFVYRPKGGSVADFDIVGKESLTKEDARRLLDAIHSANPKVEFHLSE